MEVDQEKRGPGRPPKTATDGTHKWVEFVHTITASGSNQIARATTVEGTGDQLGWTSIRRENGYFRIRKGSMVRDIEFANVKSSEPL